MPRARRLGVATLLTPVRAPRANAVAQRFVGTLRRACLDHPIVVDALHRRAVLSAFARYDNTARPHRALGLATPHQRSAAGTGTIRVRPVLGGLHHLHERAA